MQIVETREAFVTLLRRTSADSAILIPVFSDVHEHPISNPLSVLGVYLTKSGETYGVPFNHSEAQNLSLELLNQLTGHFYTSNKKDLLYYVTDQCHLYDLQSLEYIAKGSVTETETFLPVTLRQLQQKYPRNRHVNRALPLVKWLEYVQAYGAFLSSVLQDVSQTTGGTSDHTFLSQTAIPVLRTIEVSGLQVDRDRFGQHFGEKPDWFIQHDTVYSQYNLYTSTGRPSCAFGGVNFAALNKHDGSRTAFPSRFSNGVMVLIDFEAYHLRLIAKLVNYTLPDTSVHEHFGRQYFKTSQCTPEQYAESKAKTMQALYSDSESTIPFFRHVNEYKQQLWKQINATGTVVSPFGYRGIRLDHIWDPSPGKVFNYLVQWAETERNILALSEVLKLYRSVSSKVILYNYDSILIDFCLDDGKKLITDTVELLEHFEGKERYPVRVYYGKNFGEIEQVNVKS